MNIEKLEGGLLVWDSESDPPEGKFTTILWRSYSGSSSISSVISLPSIVDLKRVELRDKYLAWIYQLGELKHQGKRVIDHLLLRPNLSYWWMSSLPQKFNIADHSHINDSIKALAFEEIISEIEPKFVVLRTGNVNLANCLECLCREHSLKFHLFKNEEAVLQKIQKIGNFLLPNALKALTYYLWFLLITVPVWAKRRALPTDLGRIVFFDFLVHLDREGLENGYFISNYWTNLVEKLIKWDISSTWVHGFFRHREINTPSRAEKKVRQFNKAWGNRQFHILLEAAIELKLMFRALCDYTFLLKSMTLCKTIKVSKPINSKLDLWPLHEECFRDSLYGKESMRNCLRISMIEGIFNILPKQSMGLYIAENQPWEIALISAWKRTGHGLLVGVPHTIIRFWDLRYHFVREVYKDKKKSAFPLPDILAVNGEISRSNILLSGYDGEKIVDVEALRFIHLKNNALAKTKKNYPSESIKILIFGDFTKKTTKKLIDCIESCLETCTKKLIVTYKPHPAYQFEPTASKHSINITHKEGIKELIDECDVVFSSTITSAAIDAYCAEKKVIQMLDGSTFNMSPLIDEIGAVFIKNGTELSAVLSDIDLSESNSKPCFFNLDHDLKRWRHLIESGLSGRA